VGREVGLRPFIIFGNANVNKGERGKLVGVDFGRVGGLEGILEVGFPGKCRGEGLFFPPEATDKVEAGVNPACGARLFFVEGLDPALRGDLKGAVAISRRNRNANETNVGFFLKVGVVKFAQRGRAKGISIQD
jgi:hypothetical protein